MRSVDLLGAPVFMRFSIAAYQYLVGLSADSPNEFNDRGERIVYSPRICESEEPERITAEESTIEISGVVYQPGLIEIQLPWIVILRPKAEPWEIAEAVGLAPSVWQILHEKPRIRIANGDRDPRTSPAKRWIVVGEDWVPQQHRRDMRERSKRSAS